MKQLLNTLYITNTDRYLSLDGENVVISADKEEIGRRPLHNFGAIVTYGYTGVSPALMGKCAKQGISIIFMDRKGKFLARVVGEVNGNVLLRRSQYRLADNPDESLAIAKNMIIGKIYNSRAVIERVMRDHALRIDKEKFLKKSQFMSEAVKECLTVTNIDSLRGIEGEAASVYFSLFDDMILQQKEKFCFTTRSKRPPLDNVNALLSLAYSTVTGMCSSALEAVGLDPYVGFMHTDRPGRCSLALDLVEEFRAQMCDRFVLTLINKRIINDSDFDYRESGAVLLNDNGRKAFYGAWEKRKQEEIKHPFINEQIKWGMLPYVQALLLARYIRGDMDAYPAFMGRRDVCGNNL